jgi:hypothetical protein
MKHRLIAFLATILVLVAAGPARAEFHTFRIDQFFSSPDGAVQFIVLRESQGMNGENQFQGQALRISHGGVTNTYPFPKNLPGGECGYYGCSLSPTANRRVLIANDGFAALGIVTPDFVFPGQLLPLDGGVINFANVDFVSFGALPTDGVSALNRGGAMVPNVATNFEGESASVAATASEKNFQGLWWSSPPGSEAGWGINFAHQGATLFATWFTYNAAGKPLWFIMLGNRTAPNVFSGQISTVAGPAFNSVPFDTTKVAETAVGSATITFAENGASATFAYTVGATTQTKTIVRQTFANPVPTCAWGGQANLNLATNYQDLWWAAPAGSESGWGINFTHQGDVIFGTWFTYDAGGAPLWFIVLANKQSPGVYQGPVSTVTGPSFDSVPFDTTKVVETVVGDATINFADGNHASFGYSVTIGGNTTLQSKSITRQVFAGPGTMCH